MQITTIGLDIAKNVFQVHGIDAAEKVVVRKQLRRSQLLAFFKALPLCLVGMEACATAHYWARELTKLGHRVPWRQGFEERQHLATPKLLPDHDRLGCVDPVNLKHVLGDIQSDRGNLHVDGSLM